MFMVLLLGLITGMLAASWLIDLRIRASGHTPRDLLVSPPQFDRERMFRPSYDMSGGMSDASPSA